MFSKEDGIKLLNIINTLYQDLSTDKKLEQLSNFILAITITQQAIKDAKHEPKQATLKDIANSIND